WDSVQDMMLVDRVWHGQKRQLLMHADRNGHFYILDRTNGAFLSGTPFVYQNWNTGFDAKGRPQPVPGSNSSTEGSFLVYPTLGGNLSALDMKTGAHLWHFQTGGNHAASPISYAVDGRQYLALSAGNAVFSFALPD